MPLILCAILTIFLVEEEQRRKEILLIPSVCILLFLSLKFGYGTHNYLFLLPIGILVTYAVTLLLQRYKKVSIQYLVFAVIGFVVLFAMSGAALSEYSLIKKTDNFYQIPNDVLQTITIITENNESAKVIAPKQLAPYIRQVNSNLETLYDYPEDGDVENLIGYAKLVYQEMDKSNPDVAYITEIAREEMCDFIVLSSTDHDSSVNPEKYDFALVGTAGDYKIYKDMR
ncbi:MAG: hypothetical protein PHY47_01440 [Lachnospiraceae bacterium]|nr:hypothetical protein [Lachnospiraceae bacterium]